MCAGRPAGDKTLGGFESWAKTLGGVLNVVGIPGFLDGVEASRTKTDLQSQYMKAFVQAWYARCGHNEVTTSQLLPLAGELELSTGTERSCVTKLGKMLAEREDQRFDDLVIRRGSIVSGCQRWHLDRWAVAP